MRARTAVQRGGHFNLFMQHDPEVPIWLGRVDHRIGRGRAFGVLPEDLYRHIHTIGKTGTGKSTLLESIAVQLMERGFGMCVVDPHGDLVERLQARVPRYRKNDLVLFDATDPNTTARLNPLDHRNEADRALLVSGVLATFRKVFDSWGPRLEHVFRNALFLALHARAPTLMDILRVLNDDRYRDKLLLKLTDPVVRSFWFDEFLRYPPAFRAEVVAPVQNKLAAALTNPVLRRIVDAPRSTIRIGEIMARGRVLLVNIGKGALGEDASALLGAFVVSKIQLETYARTRVPMEERTPFILIVDEVGSVATESFGELLAEARKYRVGAVLAHQYLGQLSRTLRDALLGNVGTSIVFRVGAEDAVVLAGEFAPEFSAHDLARLDVHQMAIRLAVRGTTSEGFSACAKYSLLP